MDHADADEITEAIVLAGALAGLICLHDTSKYSDIQRAFDMNDALGPVMDPTMYRNGMSQREKNKRMLGAILKAQKALQEAGLCPSH